MPVAEITTSAVAKHGFIALFGALVHALNAHRKGGAKSLLDVCILTIISSFSGVMFSLIGLHFFGQESYLTLACAGAGGFLGVEGMGLVVKILRRSIEANLPK